MSEPSITFRLVAVKDQRLPKADLPRVREGTGAHCREEGDGSFVPYNKHGLIMTAFISWQLSWQCLLSAFSAIQGVSLDDLKSKLNSASGPKTQATTPDYVKFHDDKVELVCPIAHHQQIPMYIPLAVL